MDTPLNASRPDFKQLKNRYELVMNRVDALEKEKSAYLEEGKILLELISYYDRNPADVIDRARQGTTDPVKKEKPISILHAQRRSVTNGILNLMADHREYNSTMVVEALGIDKKLAQSMLSNMSVKGYITRVGTGLYMLKGENN
jgi:hypothetical protein